jgi:hypothetical protein
MLRIGFTIVFSLFLLAEYAEAACGPDCADCYRYHKNGAICEENKVSLLGPCLESCKAYKPQTNTKTNTNTSTQTSTNPNTSRDAR